MSTTTIPGAEPLPVIQPQIADDDQVTRTIDTFIDQSDRATLTKQADAWVSDTISKGLTTPAGKTTVKDALNLGRGTSLEASEVSARLLASPARRGGKGSAAAKVGEDLANLRLAVTDFDPSRADLHGFAKVLKVIPGSARRRLEAYFRRAESAGSHLEAISDSLAHGQGELERDNVAIETERIALWDAMGALAKNKVYIDALAGATLAQAEQKRKIGDADEARTIEADLLYPIRQRQKDMHEAMVTSMQAYLTFDLILSSNADLIRGVETARTTTMTVLRNAMMASQAISQQEIVLNQVDTLNEVTSTLLVENSRRLGVQSTRISENIAGTGITLEALDESFRNVIQAMDRLDAFRSTANPAIAKTVDALSQRIDSASAHVQRSHTRSASA